MITIYYYYNDPYKHAPEGAIREETTSKSERFVKQIKINLIDSETIMVFFFYVICQCLAIEQIVEKIPYLLFIEINLSSEELLCSAELSS